MGDLPESQSHFVIERTGALPLEFDGALLAEGTTGEGQRVDRQFSISIWRSTDGHHIACVRYLTRWKTEAQATTCYTSKEARGIARALLDHDPMQWVVGYPIGAQFLGKQARLENTLCNQYRALVAKLLTQVPGAAEHLLP